jgi:spoIIIJ-associated protein
MTNEEVRTFVEDFLKRLGAPYTSVTLSEEALHPIISIGTDNAGALIGAGGETLKALNHIVRKMLEQKGVDQERHLIIDVNQYHKKHVKTVEENARLLAERARTFKYDIEMSPMNAYDRMIVHAFLANDPDISTESQGDGVTRHVVIRFKGAQASQQ